MPPDHCFASAVPAPAQTGAPCRFCGGLTSTFLDLGMSPPCESFLAQGDLNAPEVFYPLLVRFCTGCQLVQLDAYMAPDAIFTEYAYFSSYSESWLKHAADYATMATARFGLGPDSFVVEVGSNDGYLLKNFVAAGIPVLGVEPAANVARAADAKGVPTLSRFFGRELAAGIVRERGAADLIIGNNVLAQVPDLNGFVAGLAALLAPHGTITLEVPHLLDLLHQNQFDTIYHEHFSYFSVTTLERILAAQGLRLYDVEHLRSHGGSLRVYACRDTESAPAVSAKVAAVKQHEQEAGLDREETYLRFAERVAETKRRLLSLLFAIKDQGGTIAGYGAPGKGNTLLNYCGIRTDLIDYTVDRSPYKHGRYLPGTHIPIFDPSKIQQTRPDYVLILPWNLKNEIMAQLDFIREWGGRFIVPIPAPTIVSPAAGPEGVTVK